MLDVILNKMKKHYSAKNTRTIYPLLFLSKLGGVKIEFIQKK